MKELPKVFANKISDDIHNTQELFYGSDRGKVDSISVVKKINNIFASKHHVYKSKVLITLKDGSYEKIIVGKTNTDLITMSGELIKIIDVLDIKKIN